MRIMHLNWKETYFTLVVAFDYEPHCSTSCHKYFVFSVSEYFCYLFTHRYGTAKHICEEQGLKPFYHKVPNPPYPTPKNSKEPLAAEELDLDANSNTVEGPTTSAQNSTPRTSLNEVLEKCSDHAEGNSQKHLLDTK